MTTDPLADRRRQTEEALADLLSRRNERSRVGMLGAGSDDLDSGRAYLARLAAGGYAVPTWPVEQGGMGLAQAEADVVRAVLRQFEAPDLYPFMVGLDLIGPTILAHASSEQQDRWLNRIRSGEDIWCQMFSEPDAGSDLAGLKARATRDGDGWRVSGSKVWTSRAHYSQWGLLLARHDPQLPKHAGITAYAIDMAAPGVTVRPLVQMNGDAHFNEVFLDEAWIPDRDRIGAPGDGWRVAITCLAFERGALGGGLGVSEDQLRRLGKAVPSAVARDQWARRMADYKIIQWTGLRAQAARQAGKAPGPEDSGTKLRANALIKPLAQLGVEMEGAAATVFDGESDEWQSMFLMSPSLSIRGGTDEIQHNILGERVLGLPPEPRVDKDKPFSETT
jgi:alkylation response protein AidB-like acyl-CoA dehydrogenase